MATDRWPGRRTRPDPTRPDGKKKHSVHSSRRLSHLLFFVASASTSHAVNAPSLLPLTTRFPSRVHASARTGALTGDVVVVVAVVEQPPLYAFLVSSVSGPFYTSERRGGVERRQMELKGAEGRY